MFIYSNFPKKKITYSKICICVKCMYRMLVNMTYMYIWVGNSPDTLRIRVYLFKHMYRIWVAHTYIWVSHFHTYACIPDTLRIHVYLFKYMYRIWVYVKYTYIWVRNFPDTLHIHIFKTVIGHACRRPCQYIYIHRDVFPPQVEWKGRTTFAYNIWLLQHCLWGGYH